MYSVGICKVLIFHIFAGHLVDLDGLIAGSALLHLTPQLLNCRLLCTRCLHNLVNAHLVIAAHHAELNESSHLLVLLWISHKAIVS